MELLPLVRMLWSRRYLLVAGVVVAIATAFAVGSQPPASSAVAWTRVALDTPTSQLVESAPVGADSLPWRASLLSHLMATDATQRQLALRLGVAPDRVAVVDSALVAPLIPASMPKKAADAAAITGAPYVLTVAVKDRSLPVISINAAAPDRAGAERLAQAAVGVLQSEASSDGRYSSLIPTGGGRRRQSFVVQAVEGVRVKAVVARSLSIKQVGAPLLVLVGWVVAVLLGPRLVMRRARLSRAV